MCSSKKRNISTLNCGPLIKVLNMDEESNEFLMRFVVEMKNTRTSTFVVESYIEGGWVSGRIRVLLKGGIPRRESISGWLHSPRLLH